MIDVAAARELLDFGARMGAGPRAEEQLQGAVALHHLLEEHKVAYLADEVGMGKTYVALGALALFRHFDPGFRVLVIAPRENIQRKWGKEWTNFVEHIVRFPDFRVRGLDGRPTRPSRLCNSLVEWVGEASRNAASDVFLRLTSFSLPVAGRDAVDPVAARRLRDSMREILPWLREEVFDLRQRRTFKQNIACAVCCALPVYDLVIVDEGHNLKHGRGQGVADRNHVLALALGHPPSGEQTDPKLFPTYGPRARRVLLLSATPIEESYKQLWNQLDVFGRARQFDALRSREAGEDEKKAAASRFLIRRVTSIRVGSEDLTKNLYRREWRRGGVHLHDEPLRVLDPRQRLTVALVQKKVSELLHHERFGTAFQIGMLASFESFLETTKLKQADGEDGTFDDPEQTDEPLEKEGIDVTDVNRLSRDYRRRFGHELPHPKMDALVDALKDSWRTGHKALVFVRRVASTVELKRKLDECYDDWLLTRLQSELPEVVRPEIARAFARYRQEREEELARRRSSTSTALPAEREQEDTGGRDNFFAWFFRGEGPTGIVSGATVQRRFIERGAVYSTFFERNYAADLLGCRPGSVTSTLAEALGQSIPELREELRRRSIRFLGSAKKLARADRYEAVQAAAVEMLTGRPGAWQERARVAWHARFESSLQARHATQAPDIGEWLELRTFFTELELFPDLRERLWPDPRSDDVERVFQERELRAHMLASAARLGHGLIDLYVLTVAATKSLRPRTLQDVEEGGEKAEIARIQEYLALLDRQQHTPLSERGWASFDELAALAEHFDLILDVNAPDVRVQPLAESARQFGQLFRRQQPVGAMSGQVNQTLVRQFRLPGYPLVLISTDLLQEGEDLHTFCSAIHHYGISWTPSSMEQRIGRIDRVRSQSDRRLARLDGDLRGEDKLQVYFPHLEDSVELLQVQRVLERMVRFLQLMHEGIATDRQDERTIHAAREFARVRRLIPQITGKLVTAFPVRAEWTRGSRKQLAATPQAAKDIQGRMDALTARGLRGIEVAWEPTVGKPRWMGTALLPTRVQPFTLLVRSLGEHTLVRCISPVGRVNPQEREGELKAAAAHARVRLGAIRTEDEIAYDLTVEEDVFLLSDPSLDAARVGWLVRRTVLEADRFERDLLAGRDALLAEFRTDLEREGVHEA